MKKKQLVAFAVAAALAVPNTGMVASFTNTPVVVEAAASITNSGSKLNLSATAVGVTDSVAKVNNDLAGKYKEKVVVLGDDLSREYVDTRVEICSGNVDSNGTWSFVNRSQTLQQGENKIKVRYTFDKVEDQSTVKGNGWSKNSEGKYSKEFEITVIGAKTIDAKTVLTENSWPVISKKVYDADKAADGKLWAEDASKTVNAYGKFSVEVSDNTTPATGSVKSTVKVLFTLNPEWVFKSQLAANSVGENTTAISANGNTCKKTYSNVEVEKATLKAEDIDWPELKDADKAAYQGTIAGLSDAAAESKFSFKLYKDTEDTEAGDKYNQVGDIEYVIKATLKDDAKNNYQLANDLKVEGKDGVTYKTVKVKVAAPTMTASMSDVKTTVGGGTDGKETLTPEVEWKNVADDFKDEDGTLSKTYELTYEWFRNGTKIASAQDETYEVNTTDKANSGEYTFKVTATRKGTVTTDNAKIYPETLTAEAKADVVISNIEMDGSAEVTYDDASSYSETEYGKLATDVVYTITVKGITKDATAVAAVKDADGKEVSGITAEKDGDYTADAGVSTGKQKWKVTIKKNADAETYKIGLKVTDGNDSVYVDGGKTCKIGKQTVTIVGNTIKPASVKHGDPIENLTFSYGSTQVTDSEKAIADKITIALLDTDKKAYSKGYLTYATSNKTVVVELKDAYKKNYKLAGVAAIGTAEDKGTVANISVSVAQKPLKLSVKDTEIALGTEPVFEITGLEDVVTGEEVTAELTSYELVKKSDTTQTVVTNDVDKLPAGEYIVKPIIELKGNDNTNYNKTDVNAVLTIRDSAHTIIFNSKGGSDVEDMTVRDSETITAPTPTRAGYKFAGWYTDSKLTKAFDVTAPIKKDITLFAKWEKEEAPSTETPSTEKPSTEAPTTEKPSTEQPTTQTPTTQATPAAVGTTTKTSVGTYKVTASSASKKTVAFTKAASKSVKKVTIPSTVTVNGVSYKVTKIADNAFSGCKKMTKVTIPSTVTEIGASSFKNCTKLTSVTIPKNVTKIGKNAFSGDKKLKTVTIKSTKVKTIGKNAFKGISGKSTIKVPKSKKKAYKKLLKKAGYKKTVK